MTKHEEVELLAELVGVCSEFCRSTSSDAFGCPIDRRQGKLDGFQEMQRYLIGRMERLVLGCGSTGAYVVSDVKRVD